MEKENFNLEREKTNELFKYEAAIRLFLKEFYDIQNQILNQKIKVTMGRVLILAARDTKT